METDRLRPRSPHARLPGPGRPPSSPRLPHRLARPLPLPLSLPLALTLALALLAFSLVPAAAQSPGAADARNLLLRGEYDAAIKKARQALEDRPRAEDLHRLLIEGLLARGRYPEALEATEPALSLAPRSLPLRWLAREVFLANGLTDRARAAVAEIPQLVSQRPTTYRDGDSLVALGRAMLALGADPKEILDKVYATAKRVNPDLRDIYLAAGELALEKHDDAVAARQFDEGLKKFPKDPDLLYGRARAFASGDRQEMGLAVEAVLEQNPRHIPALLLVVEQRIDSEEYEAADQTLRRIRDVNPSHPEAWSYAAVIAHLRNDAKAEGEARDAALRYWTNNPNVPFWIGRKLSQKYRFAEGAALQRQALAFDPEHLPAMAQLATDLLRLGEDREGWDLAQQIHERDAYDVSAYNLVTLRDTMAGFATLTNDHFVVRLHAREAAIYGPRVLALLERARTTLASRYGLELDGATTVEIFPEQKDFGVRTFGMPDNPGYLGVCFGRVITANSPAANRRQPVNWEAVLWHEFCHVVTLQLTANKMPRWLSEGISVYEERQANPGWGERMNPSHREMILGDDLTPISRLSAAFLMPKSPAHLQFAYFESSLVVEFLIQRHGIEAIQRILRDLRAGTFINDAIERHVAPLETLEKDFAAFARAQAEAWGAGLDWEEPPDDATPSALRSFVDRVTQGSTRSPTNYWALKQQARSLIEKKDWTAAKEPLGQLLQLLPDDTGPDGAYALLARVHRALGEPHQERLVLSRWAEIDGDATDAYLRLMELALDRQDWDEIRQNGDRQLAVNPLIPAPYRYLARAFEATGDRPAAIGSYRTLLQLDPPNPPEVQYALARLLRAEGDPAARRHLLEALEEAPRHRDALRLLLELGPQPAPVPRTGDPE